jgi:NAD(P)-dependent dehydrogenase (short-subunit alcohol dehydrogenase family)
MSEFDFNGAVAVVTGGAGGIGEALAVRLAAEGCRVAVVDLALSKAEATAQTIAGAIAIGADVGDREAVQAMVEEVESRLGPIDIYCSNAGIGSGKGLGEDEDWDLSWKVHGMAHIHAARSVVPGMTERGRGAVVITASAAGLLMMMQSAPYTVTKHAAVAAAEWLAVHYGGGGVQFHCLCPQGVRTPMVTTDPQGQSEVAASGVILEPSVVAGEVVAAIRSGSFLILPHPEVHDYEKAKVDNRDRWLAGMRRLLAKLAG